MRYIGVHVTIKICVSFPVNSATTTWTVPMAEMNWAVCQPKLMEMVSVFFSAKLCSPLVTGVTSTSDWRDKTESQLLLDFGTKHYTGANNESGLISMKLCL